MTKEEREKAIDLLDNLIGMVEDNQDNDYDKALKMGIESLRREPSTDAVSRQSVKDGMIKYGFHAQDMTVTEFVEDVLPPVAPAQKWIPVSERLPEDAYGCLVTVYDTDLRTQDEFENILPYFVGYDGETWNDADGEPISFEVIAWMPLPKPYSAEMEDEDDSN